jgi:glycosyltransferase involved in cell wall biosynthesis
MHVLLVNNIYPPFVAGGAELIVAWLAEGLAERGHRVTVVSTCGPEMEPYPVEEVNGVTVIRFFPDNLYWNFTRGPRQSRMRKARWHLRDAWNRAAGRRFRRVLEQAAPDVMHTHLIDGLSATVWHQAKAAGVPVLHTAHDYHLMCPRAFMLDRNWNICRNPSLGCRLYRSWHLSTARSVDLFTSPSRFLLDQHQEAGLTPNAVAVVPNGIPMKARPVPPRGDRIRLLLMCRLTIEKGVRVVLDAMARLPAACPVELVVAGRGVLEQEVMDAAERDPRISFAGYVSGLAKEELLASANHVLLPSLWYENAPVSIIEAAAFGLGVIGSRIGAIPEFVQAGRTGVLFPPGDAQALAATIEGLADGSVALPYLSENARAVVEAHSVERMVKAYEGLYHDLLGSRPDGSPTAAEAAERQPAMADDVPS